MCLGHGARGFAKVEELDPTAADLFGGDKENHQHQNHTGNLCRAARVVAFKPDVENSGRQGLNGEIIDGSEVIDGFHHHNRHARSNRWPRQRQGHAPEPSNRACAQGPRHLVAGAGLFAKSRAGEDIDIGVKRC